MSDEPISVHLRFPDDFDEYAWEVELKGHFHDAVAECEGQTYRIAFYDSTRLGQDVESELQSGLAVMPANLVVVESVTPAAMEEAVRLLFHAGRHPLLRAD